MLIDTHAHLYWESYQDDFDQVITRAQEAGIGAIINIGVDVETSQKALQVSEKLALSKVEEFSSIGLHPHEAIKYSFDQNVSIHQDIDKLTEIYQQNISKVVAVGECGLDFKFDTNDPHPTHSLIPEQIKELQIKLFQAQIDLAKKLKLPLLVHCRDDRSQNPQNNECWDKTIALTKEHFGVYHCYSGLLPTTNYILQTTNFLISFAGNITYPKNDYLLEAIKLTPLNRILIETDCPFLPPQSKRGQRNEPGFIVETAKIIADLKKVNLEQVAEATWQNAYQIGLIKI